MIRLKLFAIATLLSGAAGLALAKWIARLLHLSVDEAQLLDWTLGALGPAVALTSAAVLSRRLDRQRVLELPGRLASSVLWVEVVALIFATSALALHGTALPAVVGMALCAGALLGFLPVPIYALARTTLWTLALGQAESTLDTPIAGRPRAARVSLGLQLGYSIAAACAAALVPAAVVGAARLDEAALIDAANRARDTGARLAAAAEPLDVAAATILLTHTPLAGGARPLLLAPSGTLLPEDAALEVGDRPFVEIVLGGALRGGALRVTYQARPAARGLLLGTTLSLLVLAFLTAGAIGSAARRDIESVAKQIDRIARQLDPGRLEPLTSREVARVAKATNRLLDRIPRFTIESFLAIERSTEAERLKSQFLANMSHDLRSPLNSILGFSELLLRGIEGPIQPGQEVALAAIQARGLHILRLLSEILDTAKVESGKMELHRQRVAPVEILRQAVQDARRGRPASAADRLAVVLQPGAKSIFCDPLRLTQTATHLLNYGLDMSPAGDVVLRAHHSQSPSADRFVLELEFSGALPPDAELFATFRPKDAARGAVQGASSGLNLALPLARRLIELHGGSVEIVRRDPAHLRASLPTDVNPRRTPASGA